MQTRGSGGVKHQLYSLEEDGDAAVVLRGREDSRRPTEAEVQSHRATHTHPISKPVQKLSCLACQRLGSFCALAAVFLRSVQCRRAFFFLTPTWSRQVVTLGRSRRGVKSGLAIPRMLRINLGLGPASYVFCLLCCAFHVGATLHTTLIATQGVWVTGSCLTPQSKRHRPAPRPPSHALSLNSSWKSMIASELWMHCPETPSKDNPPTG